MSHRDAWCPLANFCYIRPQASGLEGKLRSEWSSIYLHH
jgi:hypothetical protein